LRIFVKKLENIKFNCLQCTSSESFFAVLACIEPDLRLFKVPIYANLVGVATFGHVTNMATIQSAIAENPMLSATSSALSSTEPELLPIEDFPIPVMQIFRIFAKDIKTDDAETRFLRY